MVDDALPAGWQEVDDTDQAAGRYNPKPISRFEHADTGLGIRLTPADPNAGTGSGAGDESDGEGEYQVTVGEDGSDGTGDMTVLTSASGHADALGVAREFMDAYHERCVEGNEDLDTVLREYGDRAA